MKFQQVVARIFLTLIEIGYSPILIVIAVIARLLKFTRNIDVGIGPEPLINNIYHKQANLIKGYSAETYTYSPYYITDKFDKILIKKGFLNKIKVHILQYTFLRAIFKYKILYIYFNGGPLMASKILWRLEPYLFKISGNKIVVMPYGGDVQFLNNCPNLYFKHCMIQDYPSYTKTAQTKIQTKINIWTKHANFIISGCDWVDYTPHWDKLMIGHFAVNIQKEQKEQSRFIREFSKDRPLKLLHAPNHKNIKGTYHIENTIKTLKAKGYPIELKIAERISNEKLMEEILDCDIVIDQLVIGWYAMFAIEAMARNKPVICYLREDLCNLYEYSGLFKIKPPIINTDIRNFESTILKCLKREVDIIKAAKMGKEYVMEHHSIEAIGEEFSIINSNLLRED